MPQPPDYAVDWPALTAAYPWLEELRGCPQDPIHHAEGDVFTHVRLVCEAMAALPAWRTLPEPERVVTFAAALLHDLEKPACTQTDAAGRVTAPKHALKGAIRARRLLWEMGWPFAEREQVCGLIRWHQKPFHIVEDADLQRQACRISQTARCDLLTILAEADALGRVCLDPQRLLDNVALFAEHCREDGCWDRPRPFPTDHTRFVYFREEGRHPDVPAHDDTVTSVVMLAGLPGSGKDHWIRENLPDLPVIALDDLRDELEVAPTDDQGGVLARARELAREYLRQRRPFVWNATNVSRQLRQQSLHLFAAYRARIRIVYRETPEERLFAQNRRRPRPVPEDVIRRLLRRWEVPDLTEAQEVTWAVEEAGRIAMG
jgi:predicted kinase